MRLDELRAGLQSWLADASRTFYSLTGPRVHYEPLPQYETYPLISLDRLPGSGEHGMGTRATPLFVVFQVSAVARKVEDGGGGIAQAEQILSLILDELDGHSGLTGGATIEGSRLLRLNPEVYDPDSGLHWASADFEIVYQP